MSQRTYEQDDWDLAERLDKVVLEENLVDDVVGDL
jgi:hypothetical protein